MYANASTWLKKYDVLIDRAAPDQPWRIIDHWRDVFTLERMDGSGKRRFVYAEELGDQARFRLVDARKA